MSHNIPLFKVYMSEEAPKAATEVLKSGFIGQGPVVDEFEKHLRNFFKNDYVVTVNSATSAEHLALHMLKKPSLHKNRLNNTWLGLEDGDEVLATPLTCTATNFPILANNLNIKWVDIDPKTLNMDLDDLARKITKKTKVIFLVHWGGYPMDLEKLAQIQQTAFNNFGFKPVVIEDCAHSLGSKFNGKPIGTHGNICTFSFQAIKHLTSVDGGVLLLPHKELYQRARLMRWYGIDRDSDRKDFRCEANIDNWGFKFHMNDVCATIGNENLKEANYIISKHQENAAFYDKELKNIPGLTLLERDSKCKSSFWIYSMLVENRDGFYAAMKEKNIVVSQVHERNDIHSCVTDSKTLLPNLDATIGKLVNIPVGWWVTKEQREYIVNSIKKGW